MSAIVWGAVAQGETKVDTPPDWLKKPDAAMLRGIWPREALEKGISGQAIIDCKVSVQGALFDCRVYSEKPAGVGFGGAALAMAPQLLMKPAMKDGRPVAYEAVRIPIDFPSSGPSIGSHMPGDRNMQTARAVVSQVIWRTAPSYTEVVAVYPARARAAHVGGRATLSCRFSKEGTLHNCETVREEPRGFDFAKAAKSLSTRFTGPPTLGGGASISGARTEIAFTFAPETLDAGRSLIGKPQWTALPSKANLDEVLPKGLASSGPVDAQALLHCVVGPDGGLVDCSVRSESPAGLGIGLGALKLASSFRLSLWTSEGLPTIGGRVNVPIRFKLGGAAAGSPAGP